MRMCKFYHKTTALTVYYSLTLQNLVTSANTNFLSTLNSKKQTTTLCNQSGVTYNTSNHNVVLSIEFTLALILQGQCKELASADSLQTLSTTAQKNTSDVNSTV